MTPRPSPTLKADPFDSWAQQAEIRISTAIPTRTSRSPRPTSSQGPTRWAMPESHATATCWTELGADAVSRPFAEFAEPPALLDTVTPARWPTRGETHGRAPR